MIFGDPKLEAKALLKTHGVQFDEPAPGHLKSGALNYWPSTGRIHFDGEARSRPEKGLRALAKIIIAMKMEADR